MDSSKKRKVTGDSEEQRVKRSKGIDGTPLAKGAATDDTSFPSPMKIAGSSNSRARDKRKVKEPASSAAKNAAKPKNKIKKLVPPRPFPTVPTSESATGPRSAHKEGKNYICITRKTPLGAYLRRCKEVILKDGYKTLHLSAMGAAIPHLATLSVSLPSILPFPLDEIHTEILTGSVNVQDEVIPQDEDEDITYQTRSKSTLSVVIKIGNGDDEERSIAGKKGRGKRKGANTANRVGRSGDPEGSTRQQIVFQEPEQEDMDET